MTKNKSYSELSSLKTFEERFNYLKLNGSVGKDTFGSKRYLNQALYKSEEWKSVRNKVILRDNGCDLGIQDRPISIPNIKGRGKNLLHVHHINPITAEDILNRDPKIFDMDNLITTGNLTHEAIHYGDEDLLIKDPIERKANDTCPWKH